MWLPVLLNETKQIEKVLKKSIDFCSVVVYYSRCKEQRTNKGEKHSCIIR